MRNTVHLQIHSSKHTFTYSAYCNSVNCDRSGECSPVNCDRPGECSLEKDYTHPDDHNLPNYDMTPGFKPFTVHTVCNIYLINLFSHCNLLQYCAKVLHTKSVKTSKGFKWPTL